ncbi:hypothetical protein HPB52_002657 [Rhipicephalus sanguineus]|uniref:Uncharacterized protein n=1 Tax=Rhipicephalus sanguineus TaxID=34632 RepID=A0A9D4SMU1_RHISA|nr:hypothetical protein HPB52_002657 [Rhipicephalus sanguineus]
MEVVSVEGEDIQPEECGKESGWCEVRRGAKTQVGGETGSAGNRQRGTPFVEETPRNKWKNERNVPKIIKASRLPNLPTEDYRVIVRPHGGLNVSECRMDRIYCCLRNAAGVGRETAEEDSMCINNTQNILVISTPSEERARRYEAIIRRRIGEKEFETSAYRATPENTSKGLIRGVYKEESPEDILSNLRMGWINLVVVIMLAATLRRTPPWAAGNRCSANFCSRVTSKKISASECAEKVVANASDCGCCEACVKQLGQHRKMKTLRDGPGPPDSQLLQTQVWAV